MCRSRAKFKLALRYCQQHVDVMKADACANSDLDKDDKTFGELFTKLARLKLHWLLLMVYWVTVKSLPYESDTLKEYIQKKN